MPSLPVKAAASPPAIAQVVSRSPGTETVVHKVSPKSPRCRAKAHKQNGTVSEQTVFRPATHVEGNGERLDVEGQTGDSLDGVAGRPGWRRRQHGVEERCLLTSSPRGPTCGCGDGDRARLSVGMGVRDHGRANRFGHETVLVVGEVRAERCDAHRRTVAHRAKTAERRRCRVAPVLTAGDLLENLNGTGAIAPGRVGSETSGKGLGEAILLDSLVAPQHVEDRDSHFRVVCRLPARSGKTASLDRDRVEEEPFAEGVPDRESGETRVRSLQSLRG